MSSSHPEAPTEAEVIVVGGGTAGAALAARLVEGGRDVLVLEAGPDPGPLGSPRWPDDLVDATRLGSSFDWGFDSSVGYFLVKSFEIFGRSSLIHGPYATAVEGSLGFTWYPFNTRQVWIDAELAYVRNSPYAGGYYMYSVGQTGLVIPVQFVLRF